VVVETSEAHRVVGGQTGFQPVNDVVMVGKDDDLAVRVILENALDVADHVGDLRDSRIVAHLRHRRHSDALCIPEAGHRLSVALVVGASCPC